jgi:hypothetical protein
MILSSQKNKTVICRADNGLFNVVGCLSRYPPVTCMQTIMSTPNRPIRRLIMVKLMFMLSNCSKSVKKRPESLNESKCLVKQIFMQK